jgi:plastocyanin
MTTRVFAYVCAVLALAGLGAGCGGSTATGTSPTSAATGQEPTTTSDDETTTHEEATTTHEAAAPARPASRRIDPRRGGLEVVMGEWAVTPEATVIRPGPVTFVVVNRGTMSHGFEIEADEDSSGRGDDDDRHKAESRLLAPGEKVRLSLDLPPGVYKIECFVDGHDDRGMEILLEVRAGAPLVARKAESAKQNRVAIAGFGFRPAEITVRAGQAVTWENDDPAEHTVTDQGGGFGSKTLGPGARFRTVFDRPGTYRYFCALHPEMKGTVVVKG